MNERTIEKLDMETYLINVVMAVDAMTRNYGSTLRPRRTVDCFYRSTSTFAFGEVFDVSNAFGEACNTSLNTFIT